MEKAEVKFSTFFNVGKTPEGKWGVRNAKKITRGSLTEDDIDQIERSVVTWCYYHRIAIRDSGKQEGGIER